MIDKEYLRELLIPSEELRAEWSQVCQGVAADGWPMPKVTPWGVYEFALQGTPLVGHLLFPGVAEMETSDGKRFLAGAFFCPFWMRTPTAVFSVAVELVALDEVKDVTQDWAAVLFGQNVIKFPGTIGLGRKEN